MKKILLLALPFLSACQPTLIQEKNSFIEISSQATIEIMQNIEVAPNSARAFLQNGELINQGQLNLYDINCEIEINTVSEMRQLIEAGLFNIISVKQDESPIVKNSFPDKQIKLASLNYAWTSDSPVDIKRYYHFRLSANSDSKKSNNETEVRAIICRGVQDTPYDAKLPSYEEMKAAGGRYLKFNL